MRHSLSYMNNTIPPFQIVPPSVDTKLANGLVALADPTRLRILIALREGHERCSDLDGYVGIHVSDLARQLELSQPAISQHLARLRHAGLVTVARKAQFAYYKRDEAALNDLHRRFAEL